MGIVIPNVQMRKPRLREFGQVVVCSADPGSEPRSNAEHPSTEPNYLCVSLSRVFRGTCVWGWGGEGVEREGKEQAPFELQFELYVFGL